MKTCVQLNSERSERFHHKLNNMCLVGEGLECNHYKLGNGYWAPHVWNWDGLKEGSDVWQICHKGDKSKTLITLSQI